MRSSFCRKAIRYNYPESVTSKIPWRKIAEKSGEEGNWNKSEVFSAVSQKIRTHYVARGRDIGS